jgi:hypothetical protein
MWCKIFGIPLMLATNLDLRDIEIFWLLNLRNKFCESALEEDVTQLFRYLFN